MYACLVLDFTYAYHVCFWILQTMFLILIDYIEIYWIVSADVAYCKLALLIS